MPHKKVHTLGFENGRNELGGEVVDGDAVPHGPSLVEVTLRFDPEEMRRKEEEERIIPIIKVVMSKSKWESLKPNLEKEDGKTLALAVILPTNVGLEVLRDDHQETHSDATGNPSRRPSKKNSITKGRKR